MMRIVPLASGSRGNATLVEFGSTRLLVDAGLSARELGRRLGQVSVPPASVDGLLLSHEHNDHARGAERFSRLHGTPVICSVETLEAMDCSPMHFADWQPRAPGRRLALGEVEIEPFRVPHDAADPVGFVLHGTGLRVGIATDLGHVSTFVIERLRGCQVLMVESNHDDRMLQRGPYSWQLKQRVSGRLGHLSNREAAVLLQETVDDGCRAVVLAHLSEKNNTRELAQRSARAAIGHRRPEIRVATPDAPMRPICL